MVDQKSKRAIKKQVHIEGIVNDMISVSSGLQAGELIVVQGTQKLSDQSLVTF
jgi:hypothetical protein